MKKMILMFLVLLFSLTGCRFKEDSINIALENAAKLYSDNYENYEYYHMGIYNDCHIILVHLDHFASNPSLVGGSTADGRILVSEYGENKIFFPCCFMYLKVYIFGFNELYDLSYAYDNGWVNDDVIVEISNRFKEIDEKYFIQNSFHPSQAIQFG